MKFNAIFEKNNNFFFLSGENIKHIAQEAMRKNFVDVPSLGHSLSPESALHLLMNNEKVVHIKGDGCELWSLSGWELIASLFDYNLEEEENNVCVS